MLYKLINACFYNLFSIAGSVNSVCRRLGWDVTKFERCAGSKRTSSSNAKVSLTKEGPAMS